ncbi:5599_t:CDS:2 [Paraglomus brasilianum]|uniref:5599_t:CDS:1 n=1 Tax=Paraglomus brasilianum TaxID=144538 RepID=A0A9N9D5J8_9GLOM|nr:5599_t:CDS:2 [Paraglomus brasilianum]
MEGENGSIVTPQSEKIESATSDLLPAPIVIDEIQEQVNVPASKRSEQREKRLREWAIDHDEDPDKFMTITEKDINLSRIYRDRMMSDAEVIKFARNDGLEKN